MSVVRHPHDPRCAHVDPLGARCITRLCQLNPGPLCFVHAEAELHAELVEQRELSRAEIAELFDVPAEMVGAHA